MRFKQLISTKDETFEKILKPLLKQGSKKLVLISLHSCWSHSIWICRSPLGIFRSVQINFVGDKHVQVMLPANSMLVLLARLTKKTSTIADTGFMDDSIRRNRMLVYSTQRVSVMQKMFVFNYRACIHGYIACMNNYFENSREYHACIHNNIACIHKYFAGISNYLTIIRYHLGCIHNYLTCILIWLYVYTQFLCMSKLLPSMHI